MWNSAIASAPSYYGHQAPPTAGGGGAPSSNTNPNAAAAAAVAAATSSGQKHDIFVGNLAFATTEEQLYAAFSELGQIIKIRMVSDLETGKPRGFAFVEFADPQAALSAIRNMNDYEINGRKLRVNFSNSSHLETLANQLGMDLTQHVGGGNKNRDVEDSNNNAAGGAGGMMGNAAGGVGGHANAGGAGGGEGMMSMGGGVAGSKAVASALKSMNKGEMYDIVAKLKEIADTNPDEARKLLTQHPQLPEAILYCMSELDMIKTPVGTTLGMGVSTLAPPNIAPPSLTSMAKPIDPRSQLSTTMPPPLAGMVPPTMQQPPPPIMAMPSDPRARPADPRAAAAAARDPRAAAGGVPPPNFPPPPPMMQHPPPPSMPPPPMGMAPPPQQQQAPPGVAGLDPNLVQQVMALTPAQIAQLPPDKQQSILALRQQITGGVMR